MEYKERTGECQGAIKAEGARGDGGNRSSWPGLLPQYSNHKTKGKQRQDLIPEEVCASIEKERKSKVVGLSWQGAWMRWENFVKRRISWSDIWHTDAIRLKFLVQSVYDVLPSPANLFTWGKSRIPLYPLCAGKGTLRHIMSSCPRALGDGRYCWRHDQVLRTLADTLDAAICMNNYKLEARLVYFIKASECPPPFCM